VFLSVVANLMTWYGLRRWEANREGARKRRAEAEHEFNQQAVTWARNPELRAYARFQRLRHGLTAVLLAALAMPFVASSVFVAVDRLIEGRESIPDLLAMFALLGTAMAIASQSYRAVAREDETYRCLGDSKIVDLARTG
jgi:hypothetical protein